MRERPRLLGFLEHNQEARKIFGERELDIIKKQLKGINLTQSEKNRLSRDIRKKLEFIEKIAGFENEFKLKKGSEIKYLINKVVEVILHDKLKDKIKRVLLFGSTAKNERIFRSDIDIAVEFDEITNEEAFNFRVRIAGEFSDDKVDVQVFNILPEKIKKSILNNHKVLYENE
ncbi:nucleotidyltransferase domain-containing protein [Candidatus Pacearchaeota archaeon]|nr:nucleotidyltransferase domain-containing protein [Candidatus Pacearchaeota archaeon]